ncbi:MAG TPA: TetR family transcriptional regulator [Acetobacteraceae bacterium]|nr:TetR family transcriptional regulator [Acetobacteraceae bacterium]
MSDTEFDAALIASVFRMAAERGWAQVSVAAAARAAALPLHEARARFPSKPTVLVRFGRMADQAALMDTPAEGPVRDRLFDLLMRRFDALQAHRGGILALLRALPADPPTALLLALTTRRSMRWMLEAVDVSTRGLRGELRVRGLMAVWLWTLRSWEQDETEDLSTTMAALDATLRRAETAAGWLGGGIRRPDGDASAEAALTSDTPPDGMAAPPGTV